jgi:acylphosphatase
MAEPKSNELQRREAYYSGRVQGVGFRYTVRHLAQGFRVTGFIRNLPDGRVQLVAEGPGDEIAAFMDVVADRMANYIHDVAIDVRPGTGEFSGFEIRY